MKNLMNMASASLRDIEESLYTEVVTLEEYLRIYANERDTIESAEIIPPELGKKEIGKIRIVRKYPVFKPIWNRTRAS